MGKVRIWKVSLGGVAGTLIVAILVGMIGDIKLNDEVKTIAFAMFIFTLGYVSGPTFIASLNRQSLEYGVHRHRGRLRPGHHRRRDPHHGARRRHRGRTPRGRGHRVCRGGYRHRRHRQAPALGCRHRGLLQANVGTAYSISYICGLITIVLLSSQLFPLIMRISLRDEAAKLWKQLGGGADEEPPPAAPRIVGRIYRVANASGKTVAQVLSELVDETDIEQVSRGGKRLEVRPDLELADGDHVLVVGLRGRLRGCGGHHRRGGRTTNSR